jgi:hypothetical protein
MRVPDNLLNDEGKRIAKRGGRCVFSLLIATALSYIGLLVYLRIAPQPNLPLIEFWFAGPGIVSSLGITLINRSLSHTLRRYQVINGVNERTTDSG